MTEVVLTTFSSWLIKNGNINARYAVEGTPINKLPILEFLGSSAKKYKPIE